MSSSVFVILEAKAGVFEFKFPESFTRWTDEEVNAFLSEVSIKYADVHTWTPFRRELMLALNTHYFSGSPSQEVPVKLLAVSLFLEGRNLKSFDGVTPKPSSIPMALISLASGNVISNGSDSWIEIFESHTNLLENLNFGIPTKLKVMPQADGGKTLDPDKIFEWQQRQGIYGQDILIHLRAHFKLIRDYIADGSLSREGWDQFGTRIRKLAALWGAMEKVMTFGYTDENAMRWVTVYDAVWDEVNKQKAKGFKDLEKKHSEFCEAVPTAVAIYMM